MSCRFTRADFIGMLVLVLVVLICGGVRGLAFIGDCGMEACFISKICDNLQPSVRQGNFVASFCHSAGAPALLTVGVDPAVLVLHAIVERVRTGLICVFTRIFPVCWWRRFVHFVNFR